MIAISNVMLLTSGGVATRVGYRVEGTGASSRRVRYRAQDRRNFG